MSASDPPVPRYTEAERIALVEQQFAELEAGSVSPEFALKEIRDEDRKPTLDFIESENRKVGRNVTACSATRPCTDMGNAERLVDQFGTEIKYCHPFKSWFIWSYPEGRWKQDVNGTIFRISKDVTRRILVEASKWNDVDAGKKFAAWAFQCENRTHQEGMITLAQYDKSVIISPEELDRDDFLFNLRNGTFNLKTFELQPHDKKLNISKLADYEYDPAAQCPMFLKYLDRIFRGNKNKDKIISYLQRAVGYTLTGSVIEQAIFLPHGVGANGKSVFLETVRALMGEYGTIIESKSLTTDRSDINNDIACLAGMRFVYASENNSDSKLDEEIIKKLSGGEPIKARFLHQEYFTFFPRFKLFWAFNHPPVISDQTHSIWRRLKIIPFQEVIPVEEMDRNLVVKLTTELPGIFVWAIEGLKEYYKNGLQEPEDVTGATTSYRNDQDILRDFFDDMFEITDSELDRVRASDLYTEYKNWWFNIETSKPLSSTKFGRLVRERGLQKVEDRVGKWYTHLRYIKVRINRG